MSRSVLRGNWEEAPDLRTITTGSNDLQVIVEIALLEFSAFLSEARKEAVRKVRLPVILDS